MSFVSNRGPLPLLAGVWNRAPVASRRGVSVGVATGAVAGPLQLSQCSLVFGGHVFAEQDDGLSEPLFAVRERMQVFCGEVPLPARRQVRQSRPVAAAAQQEHVLPRPPLTVAFDEMGRGLCAQPASCPAGGSAGAHCRTTGTPSAGAVAKDGCPFDLVRQFTSPSCVGSRASAASLPPVVAYGRPAARQYPAGRAGAIMESRRSDQLQPSQHGTYSYSGASGRRTTLCTYYSSCPIVRPSMCVVPKKLLYSLCAT